MKRVDDRLYFSMRAERERALACTSESKDIAQIHLTMAQAYDRLLTAAQPSGDILAFRRPR